METIKNSKELAKLVDKNKDLFLKEEDVRIEFEPTRGELRDVYCRDLFMMDDNQKFDFNGRDFNGEDFNGLDFNGRNFNGRNFNGEDFNGLDFNGEDFNGLDFNGLDFNGWNFNGRDFNGLDFNGLDFNGEDFNGKKVSYYAFFNCYGSIKCESIEGRREPHQEPVCLDGKLEIIKEEVGKKVKIKLDGGQILEGTLIE